MNPNQKALLGCLVWPIILVVVIVLALFGLGKALGAELRHLCYFQPTDCEMARVQIIDPNGWHPSNIDRAFNKLTASNADHLQADIEVKGLSFKELRPNYSHALDCRSLDTLEVLRQLECEAVHESFRRAPRYPVHVWINGNHQKNREAVLKLNNQSSPNRELWGLLRSGVILDVEHFYSSKQKITAWFESPHAGAIVKEYAGPCCLCVNINDHHVDPSKPFPAEVLRVYEMYARKHGFVYIGWHVFNNDAMAYGSYVSSPELANWREVVK
jgi:hypothetical protein